MLLFAQTRSSRSKLVLGRILPAVAAVTFLVSSAQIAEAETKKERLQKLQNFCVTALNNCNVGCGKLKDGNAVDKCLKDCGNAFKKCMKRAKEMALTAPTGGGSGKPEKPPVKGN